ncbi:MAG: rhomboid family intramembrane serine protease [Lachnospiraceae bacterium]|nr:rhomboid family intramembrane serine protease [Lachnospiraceae bacterium]
MRIRDLYRIKGFPFVTVILSIFSFVISCVVWLQPELFDFLCIETRPKYFWQYFSGCFIHSVEPRWSMWIHMGMNFMGLIPLGIITEKVIGTKNMFGLFLGELTVTAVVLQVVTLSNPGQVSGISSISYAFATVAFYCVYKVIKKKEVSCLKQVLFYYCVFEFWGMLQMLILQNPINAPMSFAGHISGIVVGIVAIILTSKNIHCKIDG